MKLSAVIFDLDGTVLNNEDAYAEAFRKVLLDAGIQTSEKHPHTLGIGVRENWVRFQSRYQFKSKKNVEQLTDETQKHYLVNLDKVEINEGFADFANDLKNSGISVALATSNEWLIVEEVLDKLSLHQYFDVITTAEEVMFKKPDPDIFLLTADKLDARPADCLVIEDSPAGIEAAHRAGMKAVAMSHEEIGENLEDADLVVESFSEITPKAILEI